MVTNATYYGEKVQIDQTTPGTTNAVQIVGDKGDWETVLMDIDRDAEFAGDDVDQYSSLVNLGAEYKYATVFIPALDAAATITPYLQRDSAIATVPVISHFWNDADADTNVAQATASGSGGLVITFFIGCCQYLRLKASADQAADRTFYVKGHN
jgi:hypothetical protein